jgi:hypothetical protein
MTPNTQRNIQLNDRREALREYKRQIDFTKGIQIDPTVQAIKRRELPVIQGGQSRTPQDISADAWVFSILGATVGVVGACVLLYVLFGMRGA